MVSLAAESRWKDIFDCLKNAGFEVYSPGVKIGDCTKPYLVVKKEGSTRRIGISTNEDYYSVMVFTPQTVYSETEPTVQKVLKEMKKLEPMILPYGQQTPTYFDSSIKGYMTSIMYKNYKKML